MLGFGGDTVGLFPGLLPIMASVSLTCYGMVKLAHCGENCAQQAHL